MSGTRSPVTSTLLMGNKASVKRLAWAFGCSKTGSDEERELEQMLRERILGEGTSGKASE